jgi:hypothetical protein
MNDEVYDDEDLWAALAAISPEAPYVVIRHAPPSR